MCSRKRCQSVWGVSQTHVFWVSFLVVFRGSSKNKKVTPLSHLSFLTCRGLTKLVQWAQPIRHTLSQPEELIMFQSGLDRCFWCLIFGANIYSKVCEGCLQMSSGRVAFKSFFLLINQHMCFFLYFLAWAPEEFYTRGPHQSHKWKPRPFHTVNMSINLCSRSVGMMSAGRKFDGSASSMLCVSAT